MAGTITTLRRWLLTSEEPAASRTHPEKIVQRIADQMDVGELDDQLRRRPGDTIHHGHDALWRVILGAAGSGRDVHIARDGHGLGLWTFGFNVLLPAIGAHPGTWTWKPCGPATATAQRLFGDSR